MVDPCVEAARPASPDASYRANGSGAAPRNRPNRTTTRIPRERSCGRVRSWRPYGDDPLADDEASDLARRAFGRAGAGPALSRHRAILHAAAPRDPLPARNGDRPQAVSTRSTTPEAARIVATYRVSGRTCSEGAYTGSVTRRARSARERCGATRMSHGRTKAGQSSGRRNGASTVAALSISRDSRRPGAVSRCREGVGLGARRRVGRRSRRNRPGYTCTRAAGWRSRSPRSSRRRFAPPSCVPHVATMLRLLQTRVPPLRRTGADRNRPPLAEDAPDARRVGAHPGRPTGRPTAPRA